MLNRYFSKIKSNEEMNHPFEYFFDDILERDYQITGTKNVDGTIKYFLDKVVQFSNELTMMKIDTNGELDDEQKEAYDTNYRRLCYSIEFLTQNALETIKQSDDYERKKEILKAILKFHDFELSMDIDNPELVNDVQKVIFDSNIDASLGERIWKYEQFTKNGLDFSECGKSIEEYCIEHEIIKRSDFSKADMLRRVFKYYGENFWKVPDEKIKDILSNFSYKEVDGNYELYYHGINPYIAKEINSACFDDTKYKRLSDDIDEKNIDRKISRFTNSLIDVDEDSAKFIVNQALYDLHEDLTLDDIAEIVANIQQTYGYYLNEIFLDNLQEFYITKASFSKSDMLLDILEFDDLKNIQDFKYQKIGSHYELSKQRNLENTDDTVSCWKETRIYKEDGTEVFPSNRFAEEYEKEQTIYSLYNKEDNNLLEKARQFNQAQTNKFSEICIIGNEVIFKRWENDEVNSYTYTLNQFGKLELVTPEVPRRIVDDMSELDIQLMQETQKASVTITDLERMAQNMFPRQVPENELEIFKEGH